MNKRHIQWTATAVAFASVVSLSAQATPPATGQAPSARTVGDTQSAAPVPDYVIGADDVLSIIFWRQKDMTTDVIVRPDGFISLPLLNDVKASGLTPDELRRELTAKADRFVQDANVTVVVKTINSRRVFITGQVPKPGPYPLMTRTTVLQLISTAGGLLDYAKAEDIVVMRDENGRPQRYPFNYKGVIEGKNLKQNIELKPGDTVIVP